MSRLIDVTTISRFIENEVCFDIACNECDEKLKAVCHFVNNQPADYSVDKVVEKIHDYFKGQLDIRYEELKLNNEVPIDAVDDLLSHNKAVCNIVEKGGVADET